MKNPLKELEREGTRRLKQHRGIRFVSYQRLIDEAAQFESEVAWALRETEKPPVPPPLPATAPPRRIFIGFAKSVMP